MCIVNLLFKHYTHFSHFVKFHLLRCTKYVSFARETRCSWLECPRINSYPKLEQQVVRIACQKKQLEAKIRVASSQNAKEKAGIKGCYVREKHDAVREKQNFKGHFMMPHWRPRWRTGRNSSHSTIYSGTGTIGVLSLSHFHITGYYQNDAEVIIILTYMYMMIHSLARPSCADAPQGE